MANIRMTYLTRPIGDLETVIESGSNSIRRPQLVGVLAELRRTMDALDEARIRVANMLNLPEPSPITTPLPFQGFLDSEEFSRIRRKNRTCLDDAILRCLIS